MTAKVEILVTLKNQTQGEAKQIASDVQGIGKAADVAKTKTSGFFSNLLSTAGGVLTANVIGGIGSQFIGIVGDGLAFNNTMEIVTAQLNAFTKDGAKSAQILEMIKDRASKTPFEFEQMAAAATSLLPASKASGAALEDLIAKAEILAASNPAEGLEGAAFALKEAVSGDFTSVIERFNLPRQRLNELKEQGVPALEAVQIAMQELGLDTDLVSNLAETASGRWSTFKDSITGLAAQVTKPIFDTFSQGLAEVNVWITANQPLITAFAATLAGALSTALSTVTGWFTQASSGAGILGQVSAVLSGIWTNDLQPAIQTVGAFFQEQILPILTNLATALSGLVGPATQILAGIWTDVLWPALNVVWGFISTVLIPILSALAGWLAANLPPAAQTLENFLTTILFPALHTVYDFISANVIPIFGTLVQWLITEIPTAVQATANFWNTVLKPALDAVWAFVQNNVIPIFTTLATGTFSTVNTATQGVSSIWTGVLQPALNAVWGFIQNNVIPIFDALANVAIAVVKLEARMLADLWTNVLKPALDTVWSFVSANVIPILNALAETHIAALKSATGTLADVWTGTLQPALATIVDFIGATLNPAMSGAQKVIDAVSGAIGAIGSVVSGAIDGLNRLADAINSIPSMPSLSVPGFAGGVRNFGGGLAMVGERGPELMALPRGTSVYSNRETRDMLSSGSAYNFTIDARGAAPGTEMRVKQAVKEAIAEMRRGTDARGRMGG